MANANYQLANRITFYPSAVLNAYVTGRFSGVLTGPSGFDTVSLSRSDMYNLITLNPVNTIKLSPDADSSFVFRGEDNLFNHDFFMVLNHDLKTSGEQIGIVTDGIE